jgi:SAM-dependent methyltransferase
LAGRGCSVTGIDLNEKMVDIAVKRAGTLKSAPPRFLCRSMLEIQDSGKFNGAVCFGNTLPHLPSTDDVLTFMKVAGEILYSGGRLIIQIINFDNIIGRKTFSFTDIDTGKAVFKRRYEISEDGMINFIITLQDKLSGEEKSDSTRLLPLYRVTMKDMLVRAGFQDIKVYTGYDRQPSDGTETASIYSASWL